MKDQDIFQLVKSAVSNANNERRMIQVTEYDDSDVSPAIGDWSSVSLARVRRDPRNLNASMSTP